MKADGLPVFSLLGCNKQHEKAKDYRYCHERFPVPSPPSIIEGWYSDSDPTQIQSYFDFLIDSNSQ